MKLVKVDVVGDILDSRFGYSIDIDLASNYLENHILNDPKEAIYLFDFTEVVFDHYFTRFLGPLFERISNVKEKFDVVFRMEPFQIDDLLLGLIEYLQIEYSSDNDGNIQDFFINNNYSIKIIREENKVSFLSKKCVESDKILNFINEKLSTDFDALYKAKLLAENANLYPRLQDLLEQRCIYTDSQNNYYSIYKFLNH